MTDTPTHTQGTRVGETLAERVAAEVDLPGAGLTDLRIAQVDLTGATLADLRIAQVDLTDEVLADVVAAGIDLRGATLADLAAAGVDLTGVTLDELTAAGIPPLPADVPVVPDLHEQMAEAVGTEGVHLNMGIWHHDCGTRHCRAGWAVVLAGEAGRTLERQHGTPTAAAMIYLASDPGSPLPDWYDDDEAALTDIRDCVERARNRG